MKTVIPLILVLLVATGCATQGIVPGNQESVGSSFQGTASAPLPPTMAPPSQDQNIGPRLVIPTTGGAPVMGIPLGGNIYLPVTGGEPVVGIPISP
jgi:hypothetical protein